MMKQSALIHAVVALCLAACVASALAAESDEAIPTPAQISELETGDTESWIAPMGLPRAVTDWDLYAGSVYANTSPLWVQAEYLLWWMRGNPLPPLVTSSAAGTPRSEAGVLGAPGTRVLLGGERVDDDARSGFRTSLGVRLGHWFDVCMDTELQFDYLWLGDGQTSGDFRADSLQYDILARPFYNAELEQQDAQLISFPNVATGGIWLETSSDFRAAGVVVRQGWLRGERGRLEWLAGYRYLQLQEELLAYESLVSTDPGGVIPLGTTFDIFEDVSTWNEFHGGDIGLQWWTHLRGWTVETTAKVAIGGWARSVEIRGETLTDSPGDEARLSAGGLLALPTNLGRHQSSSFSMAPELSIKVRRQLSRFLVLTLGYSVLVVDNVVRTGDQLDLVVNPTQINGGPLSGVPRPAVLMNDSRLWLQGFNIGLEW
ncbi:MAG: BBP7 family outer membrane beta-barrel protein [Pirellulaceae bacterium]